MVLPSGEETENTFDFADTVTEINSIVNNTDKILLISVNLYCDFITFIICILNENAIR